MNGSTRALPPRPLLATLLLLPALALAAPEETATPEAEVVTPTLAPSGALLLPFRPLGDEDVGARRMDWVLEQIGDGTGTPDLHRSSRLRLQDDRGHHNDFRLKHSGNLLHIPLGPSLPSRERGRVVPVSPPGGR